MGRKSEPAAPPPDNTSAQIKSAQEVAIRQAEIAREQALEMQARSLAAAKESVSNIKQATGKTAQQYIQEAEKTYGTIIPSITAEYKEKIATYDPEKALRPFSETAIAGVQQAGTYTGEKVKQDVGEYGGMLAAGATLAGEQLSKFSRQAAKQQKQAFQTFQRAALGAQRQGEAQSYRMARGLSNLYNPEYQALMAKPPTARSTVLEETMARSLYPNV